MPVEKCYRLHVAYIQASAAWLPYSHQLVHHTNSKAMHALRTNTPPTLLTSSGLGSMGSALERSPAIIVVCEDPDRTAAACLKVTAGVTKALAPAAMVKVAVAISNFMVLSINRLQVR